MSGYACGTMIHFNEAQPLPSEDVAGMRKPMMQNVEPPEVSPSEAGANGRSMSGADLRAHRKAAGLTQIALAGLAGCRRETVQYHEAKAVLDLSGVLIRRLCEIMGLRYIGTTMRGRARARWGLTSDADCVAQCETARLEERASFDAKVLAREVHRQTINAEQRIEQPAQRKAQPTASRPPPQPARCGAMTRKATACRNISEPGRLRCKFHGGMSTGPRTSQGRARIAQAQRQRWAVWRAAQKPMGDSNHDL